MQQQPIENAISTADLFCALNGAAGKRIYTLRDLLANISQVATVLGACWALHLFV